MNISHDFSFLDKYILNIYQPGIDYYVPNVKIMLSRLFFRQLWIAALNGSGYLKFGHTAGQING